MAHPRWSRGSWLEGRLGLPLIENGHASIQVVAQLDPGFGVALPLGSRRDLHAVFVEGDSVVIGHCASVLEAE